MKNTHVRVCLPHFFPVLNKEVNITEGTPHNVRLTTGHVATTYVKSNDRFASKDQNPPAWLCHVHL